MCHSVGDDVLISRHMRTCCLCASTAQCILEKWFSVSVCLFKSLIPLWWEQEVDSGWWINDKEKMLSVWMWLCDLSWALGFSVRAISCLLIHTHKSYDDSTITFTTSFVLRRLVRDVFVIVSVGERLFMKLDSNSCTILLLVCFF